MPITRPPRRPSRLAGVDQSTRSLSADLQRILARRGQQIREKFTTLDAPPDPQLPTDLLLRGILRDFDEATMSASFVVSTQDVDRSEEVVNTAGILIDSHQANPVALWDHGRGPIGRVPIGKWEDADGKYAVAVVPEQGIMLARIFFSKTLPFARDLFLLVKEGILRGASLGFRTLDAEPMPGHSFTEDDPPLHYQSLELCEISLTAIPDNPRALAIKVTKAFGSKQPCAETIKALRLESEDKPMSDAAKPAKPKKFGPTFAADLQSLGADGLKVLSKALAQITGKSADEYLTMGDDGKLNDQTVADGKKDGLNTGSVDAGAGLTEPNPTTMDTSKADDPAAITDDVPAYKEPLEGPASQAGATDLHTQLSSFAESLEGWAKRQENPEFRDLLESLAEQSESALQQIESFHDGEHPDYPALGQTPAEQETSEAEQTATTEGNESGEDDEDPTKSKSARQLKAKSPARQRLEKRLKVYREKAAKRKVVTKRMGKAACGIITKAANFLDQLTDHAGEFGETHKAASGYHGKALRGLTTKGDGDTLDRDMDSQIADPLRISSVGDLDVKAWRERVEKATQDLKSAQEIAEQAVKKAEQETREKKRLLKAWNEFKKANGIN